MKNLKLFNRELRLLALTLVILATSNCSYLQTEPDSVNERTPQSLDAVTAATSVSVHFGSNVPAYIEHRVTGLLKAIPKFGDSRCTKNEKHVDFYFGNAQGSQISGEEKRNLKSNEGFIIKSAVNPASANCMSISVDGKNSAAGDFKSSRGVGYGIYAVLQDVGFKFLHPLKPQNEGLNLEFAHLQTLSRSEEPYWETRAIHLHTMHPLELTNLLNGWGVSGPGDKAGWEQMLPYWSLYLEWLTAHKQNAVEWMLLWTPEAGEFNQSEERQARLKTLTSMAKAWGVDVGIVTPVRFVQQNGWTLLRNQDARIGKPNEAQDNINEILSNVDWIIKCGFTAVGGELGDGEFSSTKPEDTLQELNAIAERLAQQSPAIPYRVKVHISQKQVAKGFKDPMTSKDINFNYLPLYADSKVGVQPHTVQIYSMKDPAPTYGNRDFSDMFRFLKMAATGRVNGKKRQVLFYPETAYWVSYDVDVPLFLPVYPMQRVEDLRMIALDELNGDMKKSNSRINGQMMFSSGWEFGFWFNDVITAEAAWNPHVEAASTSLAFQKIVSQVLRLDPAQSAIAAHITTVAEHQHDLLVFGKVNGKNPSKIEKRTGIAYLAGVETYDEVPMFLLENIPHFIGSLVPLTQPNKFREDWAFKSNQFYYMNESKYNSELKPLLQSMATVFQNDANAMISYAAQNSSPAQDWALKEFVDGTQITAYRAQFVANLYEARLAKSKKLDLQTEKSFVNLKQILDRTLEITEKRKAASPLAAKFKPLIMGWEKAGYNNPTDYHYGYVWTSYNLFYWKREFNKLRFDNADKVTCYMNLVKPSEIVGKTTGPVPSIENFSAKTGLFKSCFNVPASEPDVNVGW